MNIHSSAVFLKYDEDGEESHSLYRIDVDDIVYLVEYKVTANTIRVMRADSPTIVRKELAASSLLIGDIEVACIVAASVGGLL